MELKEQLQRKYIQLQSLRQQLSALLEEKILLDSRVNEITTTIDAVKKLHEVKKGEEIFTSLGSGTFVRADIKDIDNLIVNIGAGVFVKKGVDETIEILQSRLDELMKIDTELVEEINKFNQQIQKIEPEIQKLASELTPNSQR